MASDTFELNVFIGMLQVGTAAVKREGPPRLVTAAGGRWPQEEAREGTDEGDRASLSCQYALRES